MKRIILSVVLALLVVGQSVRAEGLSRSRQAVKVSSDVLLVAMPVATASAMLAMKDWTGFKQAAFTGLTTLGATYLLKFAVHKERPDHSNNLSFPSGHTSVTFANAAFVQRRYGWAWGCSGLCRGRLCGLGPYLCPPARLVGCGRRSPYRCRQCLYLYPSLCA